MMMREPLHRRSVLKALLLITAAGGVIFFLINFPRGLHALAFTELVASFCSLLIYRIAGRTARLDLWILLYLIPFLTIMMFALAQPRASDTVFIWVLIIPQVSYLLTGVRRGFQITAVYLLSAVVIYAYRFYGSGAVSAISTANVGLCALAIWSFTHLYELGREQHHQRLLQLASRDPLTGLYNRMRLAEITQAELERTRLSGDHVALVLLDLDYFKRINDRFGHQGGDDALMFTAYQLQNAVRRTDYVFRMGGEEFCVLLPGATADEALTVAESLRHGLENGELRIAGQRVILTASIGIAVSTDDGEDLESLYRIADQRLYQAKDEGRNRVVATGFSTPGVQPSPAG